MTSREELLEAAELIGRHFDVADASEVVDPNDGLGGLAQFLARRILELLRQDLEKLTHILYRIDVPEPLVNSAFQADSLEDVAVGLAELVVARELRTVALRRRLDDTGDE